MPLTRTIKAIGNFLLILLAMVLLMVFGVFGFVFSLFTVTNDYRWLFQVACSLDALGNTICAAYMNRYWITKNGYQFGSYKETISKVLGINKHYGWLTPQGKWVADLLNWIDKNHVEKASGLSY